MSQRNPKYDIMKGLGIILVVLGHCGMEFGHYIIYMFHMPLFFYVSGCLHKDKPFVQGVKSKFVSLAVPYIIFFTICAAFDYFIFADDPKYQINPLSPMNSGGPLWFLFAMLWTYVVFLGLNKYLPRWSFIICVIISVCSYFLSIYEIKLPLYLDSAASCLIFYAIGYQTARFRLNLNLSNKTMYAIPLALLVSLYILYVIDFSILRLKCNDLVTNDMMQNYALFLISALVGIVFIESSSIVLSRLRVTQLTKLLCRIGELSLYIFALHLLIINILQTNIDNNVPYYYATVVMVALAVSALIGCIMESKTNMLIKTLNSKW